MVAVSAVALTEPSWLGPTATWLLHNCVGVGSLKFGLPAMADHCVFLAPLTAMRQIKDENTTGKLPMLPYSTMFVCASVWTTYGLLASVPGIWMANVSGVVMGTYYIYTFCRYCPKDADWLPGKQIHHKLACSSAVAFLATSAAVLPTETALFVLGMFGNLICVVMFSSPLAAIKTVLAEKRTRCLPFAFSFVGFVNCGLWTLYGLAVLHDPFIWFSNLVGFVAAAMQMALFARFGVYRYF